MKNLIMALVFLSAFNSTVFAHGAADSKAQIKQCLTEGILAKAVFQDYRNGKSEAEIKWDVLNAVRSTNSRLSPEIMERFMEIVERAKKFSSSPAYNADRFQGYIEGNCVADVLWEETK